jgi:hypothetical protein
MAALLPVVFHGDTIYLVEHNGAPFAPMKPLAESLGIHWETQHAKIKARFSSSMAKVHIDAADGRRRLMVCLPLHKISGGWLSLTQRPGASSPPRSAGQGRLPIRAECDDALWRYWSEGHASRPSAAPAQASLDLPPTAPPVAPRRRDDAHLPGLIPPGWTADKVAGARLRLESASGILAGLQFVKDPQTKRDMLTAAHLQCQDAMLFITVQYSEVGARA